MLNLFHHPSGGKLGYRGSKADQAAQWMLKQAYPGLVEGFTRRLMDAREWPTSGFVLKGPSRVRPSSDR
jgi:hypothetical protein